MDAVLTTHIFSALGEGNIPKAIGYTVIFLVIWKEVRGVKNEVAHLNTTLSILLKNVEDRFEKIEQAMQNFEHRMTIFETKKPKGGTNGKSIRREGIGRGDQGQG